MFIATFAKFMSGFVPIQRENKHPTKKLLFAKNKHQNRIRYKSKPINRYDDMVSFLVTIQRQIPTKATASC